MSLRQIDLLESRVLLAATPEIDLTFGEGGRAQVNNFWGNIYAVHELADGKIIVAASANGLTPIPGGSDDPLVARFGRDEAYAKLGRQVPLGHIGEPDDIANACLYLASDESKFMTGAELKLDGGISAM